MVKRNQPRYPRTARLNELLREIVAEQLSRLDDERIELIAVTGVVVDADLHRAIVYFDTLGGPDTDPATDAEVLQALSEHRGKLKAAIGRQTRLKRTPDLDFRIDDVERRAERMEGIFRAMPPEAGDPGDGALGE